MADANDGRERAEELIASLAAVGDYVEAGQFSLDAEQARTKLRERRLADPHVWALLVVEAAWLLGASTLHFEFEGRATKATLDGVRFSSSELARLLDAPFMDRRALDPRAQRRWRGLERLAVAIEACFALDARAIELDSGGPGRETCRVWMGPEGGVEVEDQALEPLLGNRLRLRVEHKLGGSRLYARTTRSLLRERVGDGVAVHVDGQRIGVALEDALDNLRTAVNIRDAKGHTFGLAGFNSPLHPANVHLYVRGVWVENRELHHLQRGFCAAVDVDLAKDLSEARVREDEALDALLEQIVDAHDRLLERPENQRALVQRQAEDALEVHDSSLPLGFIVAAAVAVLATYAFGPKVLIVVALGLGIKGLADSIRG